MAAVDPSPTAAATRLTEPCRMSPAAKTPGMLVSSHDGRSVEAFPVDSSIQIAQRIDPMAQVIAIDEAQFLDDGIVHVVTSLAARGRRVVLAGLDTDFRGEPFGPMPQLMAIAEMVDKLSAICVLCGAPATRTQRLINGEPAAWDSPTIMVGGTEAYEARCRACHVVRPAQEGQGEIFNGATSDPRSASGKRAASGY